jgi:FkbM family methyltransferase
MLRKAIGHIPLLYRAANRLRGYRLHSPEIDVRYDLLGSWYGAWPLPLGLLTSDSIVYSFGVGKDITFDLGVIRRLGCYVYAFDPTPIARAWLKGQCLPEEFIFNEIGLAEFDGVADFSAPPTGHSFSRSQEPSGNKYSVARLATLMQKNNHQAIDLLKLDIEGFEYAAIDDFIDAGIFPRIINVEFHHRSYGISTGQTKASVAKLRRAGYAIFWVSDLGREYAFLHQKLDTQSACCTGRDD